MRESGDFVVPNETFPLVVLSETAMTGKQYKFVQIDQIYLAMRNVRKPDGSGLLWDDHGSIKFTSGSAVLNTSICVQII